MIFKSILFHKWRENPIEVFYGPSHVPELVTYFPYV